MRAVTNAATGERIVFLRGAAESGGELLEMEDSWPAPDHRTPEHIHPEMEERWRVLSGRVGFRIGGEELLAGPGEEVVAPPGTPHTAWNAGAEPVRLRIQMRPPLRWQEFVERLFALAGPEPGGDSLEALLAEFRREVVPVRPQAK